MKFLSLLFIYTAFVSAHCCASSDDDLKFWRERASKVKVGTPLFEAEHLLPLYLPPYSITLPDGTRLWPPSESLDYHIPTTISSGSHCIVVYWVARDIVVQIGYQLSPHYPVTNPVTVEYQPAQGRK